MDYCWDVSPRQSEAGRKGNDAGNVSAGFVWSKPNEATYLPVGMSKYELTRSRGINLPERESGWWPNGGKCQEDSIFHFFFALLCRERKLSVCEAFCFREEFDFFFICILDFRVERRLGMIRQLYVVKSLHSGNLGNKMARNCLLPKSAYYYCFHLGYWIH